MGLSVEQERAIGLLIIGEKKTVIATKCNVSRETIYLWLRNKEFKNAMALRKEYMITNAENYCLNNTQTYLEELSRIALDKKGDVRAKIGALTYLLDRSLGKTTTKVEVTSDTVEANNPLSVELANEFAKFRQMKDVVDIEKTEDLPIMEAIEPQLKKPYVEETNEDGSPIEIAETVDIINGKYYINGLDMYDMPVDD